MHFFSQVQICIKKEIQLEWRNRYAVSGILLYLASTIFICYLGFNVRVNQLNPITWNVLFWIIILFTALSAAAKSFIQDREGRYLYYYSIMSPEVLLVSRMIYNAILMILLSVLGIVIYSVVLGNPVLNLPLFIITILLASIGFAVTFTMISAIAAKARNNQTLMAVLGFPIILPLLLMVIRLSKNAMDGLAWSASYDELLTIGAINVIVGAISYILFPYLWRS